MHMRIGCGSRCIVNGDNGCRLSEYVLVFLLSQEGEKIKKPVESPQSGK